MKLLIATFNLGKLEDYRLFCKGTDIEAMGLKDLGITEEFEETYSTFEENAKAKAEFYYALSGLPTLADDSGMEIDYYHGQPGVKTKRWGGDDLSANDYFAFIVNKIKAIPEGRRQGQMRAVLALFDKNGCRLAEGVVKGTFTDRIYHQSTTEGYPWDKIFILNSNGKYYEELINSENLEFNHRRIAFDKLKPYLLKS